jgi:hypothetical protein
MIEDEELTEYGDNEKLADETLKKCYEYYQMWIELCREQNANPHAVVWVQNDNTHHMMVFTIVCDNLAEFLITKNRAYGNSALNPIRIFSKSENSSNSLLIRCDDKVNRILNSDELRENDCKDLCGYLILIMIDNEWFDMNSIME